MHSSLIFIVLLPFLASPMCAVIPKPHLSWTFAVCAAWGSFFCSVYHAFFLFPYGMSTYLFGGWPSWVGISYVGDGVNNIILLLVSFLGSVCVSFHKRQEEKAALFYSLFLLSFSGFLGIAVTDDIFNSYVCMEVTSLAACSMIAFGPKREALRAGFNYLLLGTIGASLFLCGIGFFYAMTYTLNITALKPMLFALKHHPIIHLGILFMSLGLMLKSALFPMHRWLIATYKEGPFSFIAFLSGTSSLIMFCIWMRIVAPLLDTRDPYVFWCLHLLTGAGIICGSMGAFFAKDLKEILAYSSIAHGGIMLLGIAVGSTEGLVATLCHLITHGLAKTHMFLSMHTKKPSLIGLANMLGLPFTVGFLSKWLLFKAIIQMQDWYGMALLVIGSFFSVVYSLPFLKKQKEAVEKESVSKIQQNLQQNLLRMLAVITLGLGLYPPFLLSLIKF